MAPGWSEDRLHHWLARRPTAALLLGSHGHDAAVLPPTKERDVQCADQCIEGVHFAPDARPREVGRKAAGRALSDLAATAAQPRSLLLCLAAPAARSEARMRAVITGVEAAGREVGAALVGGDLAQIPGPATLSVFAQGILPGSRKPPGRDRARPGQVLVLTGKVGGSGLGRHLRPRPRIDEGRALFEAGATAMMDVSDGLAWDLYRLARASGVRLVLEQVPLHRDARRAARDSGRGPLDHALHDGEDHELVATLPARSVPEGVHVIGHVVAGRGLELGPEVARVLDGDVSLTPRSRPWRPEEGGWKHGR